MQTLLMDRHHQITTLERREPGRVPAGRRSSRPVGDCPCPAPIDLTAQTTRGVPGWRATLRAIAATLREWRRRSREREELAHLDERILRDIGIPSGLVDYEMHRPFWQPLRDWRD